MAHACYQDKFVVGPVYSMWGAAITRCLEVTDDLVEEYAMNGRYNAPMPKRGELWVDNGEYATKVRFCPFCGYREQQG